MISPEPRKSMNSAPDQPARCSRLDAVVSANAYETPVLSDDRLTFASVSNCEARMSSPATRFLRG
jgi:hypothetical protein